MKTGPENMEYVNNIYAKVNIDTLSKFSFSIQKSLFKLLTGFFKKKKTNIREEVKLIDFEDICKDGFFITIYWANGKKSLIPLVSIKDEGIYEVNIDKLLYKNPNLTKYPIYFSKENIIVMIEYLRHILRFGDDEDFNFDTIMWLRRFRDGEEVPYEIIKHLKLDEILEELKEQAIVKINKNKWEVKDEK